MSTGEVKVLLDESSGEFQIFVDGQALTFEQAAAMTERLLAESEADFGAGAVERRSAVEQHRAGGVSHAHIVSHNHAQARRS
jgi:hypothetical protein